MNTIWKYRWYVISIHQYYRYFLIPLLSQVLPVYSNLTIHLNKVPYQNWENGKSRKKIVIRSNGISSVFVSQPNTSLIFLYFVASFSPPQNSPSAHQFRLPPKRTTALSHAPRSYLNLDLCENVLFFGGGSGPGGFFSTLETGVVSFEFPLIIRTNRSARKSNFTFFADVITFYTF